MKGLDLGFQVGDKVRRIVSIGTYNIREVEGFDDSGDMIVGGRTGPKYGDVEKGIHVPDASKWEFACHNAGAPFEKTLLDEEGHQINGYASGL